MKKLLLVIVWALVILLLPFGSSSFADDSAVINKTRDIQGHISDIGYKILNSNKIQARMIFVYDSNKESKVHLDSGLTKRQIVVYDKKIQFAQNDDEIAGLLAREICKTAESYSGMGKGVVTSAQIKLAPKKYEIFFDKRAVDFMVTAGYNPLGLITYINKAYPQKRQDKIARTNLTSKRLANIYEYIYTKYPYFLKNNAYIKNEAYQNFLLNSTENRKELYNKIKSGSKKVINYE